MQQTNPLFITCEGHPHPIGIDNPFPMFTWKLSGYSHTGKQRKIRIQAAAGKDDLLDQKNLLWDCEKETEEIRQIYTGLPLESRSSYYYRLTLTCSDGSEISSDICKFETGFLSHDCWQAKWICLSEVPLTKDCPWYLSSYAGWEKGRSL